VEAFAVDFTVSDLVVSARNISADYSHISHLKMSTPNTYFTVAHSNGKHTGKLKLHKEHKSLMLFLKHNLFNVLC
jgi:hypothetical protein